MNFIVVLDGLTNQLLGVIVRSEDPRLEEDKNRLLFQVAKGCVAASIPRVRRCSKDSKTAANCKEDQNGLIVIVRPTCGDSAWTTFSISVFIGFASMSTVASLKNS